MDSNHSASIAALANIKKEKESKRKRMIGGGGRLTPLLLISANGFCRAKRQPYTLIMQRGKRQRLLLSVVGVGRVS